MEHVQTSHDLIVHDRRSFSWLKLQRRFASVPWRGILNPLLTMSGPSASVTTPEKAGAGKTKTSPLSWVKLSGVKRVANPMQAEEDAANFGMIKEMLEMFDQNPEDIRLVYNHHKRVRKMRAESSEGALAGSEKFTSFGTLRQLDEAIVLQWLEEVSDMSSADLMSAKKFDGDAPWQLYAHAVAGGLYSQLPAPCSFVAVWSVWSSKRHDTLKKPLSMFKQTGGLKANGQIDWSQRVFKLEWKSGNVLEKVLHIPSGTVGAIPKGAVITKDFQYRHFWSEVDAHVRVGKMPPIKMLSFFDVTPDLFGYAMLTNKKDAKLAAEKEVAPCHEEFLDNLKKVGLEDTKHRKREEMKVGLEQVAKTKRNDQLATMREKALKSVAAKNTKRTLDLKGIPA